MQPERLTILTEDAFRNIRNPEFAPEGSDRDDSWLLGAISTQLIGVHQRGPGATLRGEAAELLYIATNVDGLLYRGDRSASGIMQAIVESNHRVETAKQIASAGPCVLLEPSEVIGRSHMVSSVSKESMKSPIVTAGTTGTHEATFLIADEDAPSAGSLKFGTFQNGRREGYPSELQRAITLLEGNLEGVDSDDAQILLGVSDIRRRIGELVNLDSVTAAVIAEVSGMDPAEAQEIFGTLQFQRFMDNLTIASAYMLISAMKPIDPESSDEDQLVSSDTEKRDKHGNDLIGYRLRLRDQLPEVALSFIDLAHQMHANRFPYSTLQTPRPDLSIMGIPYDDVYKNATLKVLELTQAFPLQIGLPGGQMLNLAGTSTELRHDKALRAQFPVTDKRTHVTPKKNPSVS